MANEFEVSEPIYWGNVLEEVVAQEFSKRTGLKVQRCNFLLRSVEHPFMQANLDREIIDPVRGKGILECKTASAYKAEQWEDGKVPDSYMLQVQHYLAVTGYKYAYIACLIGGQKFVYAEILPDEKIINQIIEIESDFWKMVENNEPPAPTWIDGEVLDGLYPVEDMQDMETDLDWDIENCLSEIESLKEAKKSTESQIKALENAVKASMGNYTRGVGKRLSVAFKAVSNNRVDTAKMKADGIYEKYVKTSYYKRMTIKEIENGN